SKVRAARSVTTSSSTGCASSGGAWPSEPAGGESASGGAVVEGMPVHARAAPSVPSSAASLLGGEGLPPSPRLGGRRPVARALGEAERLGPEAAVPRVLGEAVVEGALRLVAVRGGAGGERPVDEEGELGPHEDRVAGRPAPRPDQRLEPAVDAPAVG